MTQCLVKIGGEGGGVKPQETQQVPNGTRTIMSAQCFIEMSIILNEVMLHD
jgi:hypothetical protein